MKNYISLLVLPLLISCAASQKSDEINSELTKIINSSLATRQNKVNNISVYDSPYVTMKKNEWESSIAKIPVNLYMPNPMTLDEVLNIIETQYKVSAYISDEQKITATEASNNANEPIKKRVNYNGNLKGFVDYIGKVFGVYATLDKSNLINVSYFQTKTYNLDQFIDGNRSTASLTIGGSEGSGSGFAGSTESTVENNTWETIETYLDEIIGSNGTSAILEDFSIVKVTARPWIITQIDQLFERLKLESQMQVAVQYRVISLSKRKLDQIAAKFGLSLTGDNFTVASNIIDAIALDQVGGGLNFSKANVTGRLDAIVQAISQDVVSEGQFIGLPNRIMPINLTTTTSYISEISNETNNNLNSEVQSVSTNEITTGLSMLILPKVLDDGRIQLTSGFTEKKLIGFENASGVQLPTVDEKETLSTVTIDSGTVELIALYKGNTQNTQRGLQLFGGGFESVNEDKIIAVLIGANSYKSSSALNRRGKR